MSIIRIYVISTLLCLAMARSLSPSDRLNRISSRIDEPKDQSDDYVEKMADIFDLPVKKDHQVVLENCENVMCMPHYLCINDMVMTNGFELFEWRISDRSNVEKKAEKLVCGNMEMPCCADDAMKNLHQTQSEEDETGRTTSNEDGKKNKNEDEETHDQGENEDENEVINDDDTPLKNQKCGYRKQQNTATRIIGGTEAQPNEFPWVVGIFLKLSTGDLRYIGGGSLIHESVILTAAHLLQNFIPEKLVIRAGVHNILDTTTNNKRQERNVTNMIMHEDLDSKSLTNDIALIVLEQPLTLTETVNTVCLPPQGVQTRRNTVCISSGWGKNAADRHGKYQETLKKVELPIVGRRKCENQLRKTRLGPFYNLNYSLMCAGGGRQDTCKGDGGAPLFCKIPHDEDRFYQTGIVAGGVGCGREVVPGIYVNVSHFTNWILQQLRFINLELEPQNELGYVLFD